ncbi:uncharacterized protein LOC129773726 [Toxorhynchites rutilus septentrionalis]|uniref:uncharacterized protein LOC129773726 n=1 Tax=Toxorhynchites rutilus septentrionalis TaxID=329112 RepID=UPI00247B1C2A|nr:uncharacterized protein LOC129773726 [Toxorhynchites rutilus septentrionalis]
MYSSAANQSPICIISTANSLETMLQRFWEIENFDVGRALTLDEQRCEDHFRRTVSREPDGRYVVRLPLREDRLPYLGDAYQLAQRRFLSTERRFRTDSNLRDSYHQFMDEYARLGHMQRTTHTGKPFTFLPHHPVIRPDSTTTKIRVVFDGSCNEGNQLSLNDVLYAGPTVQPTLVSIVLNFRIPRYVFIADIEKMFRQIWVHPEDRRWLQIFWRINSTDPLSIFQLTTVTYGTTCAPFQATRVLMQLADDEESRFPLGAKIIRKNTYVDDTLAGGDNLNDVVNAAAQLRLLLAAGGFSLRKWCANDAKVLREIPPDLIEMPSEIEIDRSSSVKTLGLLWNPHIDQFAFKIPDLSSTDTISKRVVVSEMAQLFDPMGLVGSVVAAAKIFVQRLWIGQHTWDEPLPDELKDWWQDYREQLPLLHQLRVPRRVITSTSYAIHCFCDASERGYGCCVYIVSTNTSGGRISNLLITKSRVAPLRTQSIPRLELCAALLGSQLINQILTSTEFSGSVVFWTDSSVVLHWINSPSFAWKTFVSNRISEIQKLSDGHTWRHVPSEMNPADQISRGAQPKQILNDKLWWHGPEFLLKPEHLWPIIESATGENDIHSTERRLVVSLLTKNSAHEHWDIFERFSKLSKLLKVVSWCTRFFYNTSKKHLKITGPLTPKS